LKLLRARDFVNPVLEKKLDQYKLFFHYQNFQIIGGMHPNYWEEIYPIQDQYPRALATIRWIRFIRSGTISGTIQWIMVHMKDKECKMNTFL